MSDAPAIINRRYAVETFLGSGGMGSVYRVRDLAEDGRPLALKRLDAGGEARERFKREFQWLAALDHPGLLRVHDFGRLEDGEGLFYTCELVEGQDFFAATRGADSEALFALTRQVLEALSYLHARGLVHHDIKPDNIAVVPGEERARAVLMDFGLIGEEREPNQTARGTLHYMAPEVAREEGADRRADLYSLGVTLYQVLSRRLPFESDSALEILRGHQQLQPPSPSELEPEIPEAWSRFILRLLAKDPDARYPDADAALAALAAELEAPLPQVPGAALGSLLAGRLIGREALIAILEEGLPRPDAGVRVFLLRGPTGVGKSRLMRELRLRAQLDHRPFLTAGCQPAADSGRGFERLLRRALALPGLDREAIIDRHREGLRAVFPALLGSELDALQPRRSPARSSVRLFDDVARCLLEVAEAGPLAIALDDLHWVDETTFALLLALLRNLAHEPERCSRLPLSIYMTYRERSSPGLRGPAVSGEHIALSAAFEGLAPLFELLFELPHYRELEVGPLAEEDCAALVSAILALPSPDPELGARIFRASGGAPFVIEEVVRGFLEEGTLELRRGLSAAAAPDALDHAQPIAEVLGGRLARIPERSRRLLQALAIHGGRAEAPLLRATAELDQPAFAAALAELRGRGMLLPGSDQRPALRHRQIGDAVARALSEEERRALHARAGAAIEGLFPAPASRIPQAEALALHFDKAEVRDKALSYTFLAADRSIAQRRNEDAARQLARALELVGPKDGGARVSLQESLAEVLAALGRYAEAGAACEALAAQPGPLRLQALLRWGSIELNRGRYEAGRRHLRAALREAPPGAEDLRARALAIKSQIALYRGDYLGARALAAEALRLAESAGATPQRLRPCLRTLASASAYLGEARKATGYLARGLAGLEEDPEEEWVERAVSSRLWAREPGALARAIEGQALVADHGDGFGLIVQRSSLGTYIDWAGPLADSRAHSEESAADYERLGLRPDLAMTLNNAGVYLKIEGRFAEARRRLGRAVSLSEGLRDRHGWGVAFLNLGLLSLSLGELEAAERRARQVLEQARSLGTTWLQGHAYRALGRVLAARGDGEDADRQLQRAEGVFRMLRHVRNLTEVVLDRGELALERGDAAAAGRLLEAGSAGRSEALGADTRARLAALTGRVRAVEDPEDGLAELEVALDEAELSEVAELRRDLLFQTGLAQQGLGATLLAGDTLARALEIDGRIAAGLSGEEQRRYREHPALAETRRQARAFRDV